MTGILEQVQPPPGTATVTRVSVDHRVALLLSNGWELTINSGATWAPHDGDESQLDADALPDVIRVVLPLLWRDVESLSIDGEAQTIVLNFSDGRLVVSKTPGYEAWELNGPRGEMIIATSGSNGLAIWGPREQS